jgi:hypothetical protein
MSFLDELLRKTAGKVGKVGAAVTTGLNLPTAKKTGESIFASLQNYGGNTSGPIVWAKPVYAADTPIISDYSGGGGGGGGGAGGDTYRAPNTSYNDQPSFMNPMPTTTNRDQIIQNMIDKGGYDRTTAEQVYSGDPGKYNQEFGTLVGNAQDARQSALNGILARLNLMRDVAGRNIEKARGVRDEVVGNIGTTYQNLKTSAENRKNTSLENLSQEDLNVQNLYGRAAGNARRAIDSALTRNRMLARAMNRLNSSFYDEMQSGTNETGARIIADIGTEEADKRSGIATRTTETKNWFEEQATNIEREEAQLKSQAEREYQDQVDEAVFAERAYGIDALEEAQNAENVYQSKLAQIDQYIQNKALRLAEISATAGDRAGVINSFAAISPQLQQKLANATALNAVASLSDNIPTFTTPTDGGSNYLALMSQQQPNEQEERLKRIFGYAYT